jgi:hypothetical protein
MLLEWTLLLLIEPSEEEFATYTNGYFWDYYSLL